MHIDVIDTLAGLDRVREPWEAVYTADPKAHLFSSWPYLRSLFEAAPCVWWVLAARPVGSTEPVAFMAVNQTVDQDGLNRLRLGGWPWADYAGFACVPGHEHRALTALAFWIRQRITFDRFNLADVMDDRVEIFSEPFAGLWHNVSHEAGHLCPHITLPADWEAYLRTCLSKTTRKGLNRKLRDADELGLRVRDADLQVAGPMLEILFTFWRQKWGDRDHVEMEVWRRLLLGCQARGVAWIRTLWADADPVAATAVFADPVHGTVGDYLGAYDARHADHSPGSVLTAHGIRKAIDAGYRIYDFLRGPEPYKYSFGAVDRQTRHVTISTSRISSASQWLGQKVNDWFTPTTGKIIAGTPIGLDTSWL